VSTADRRPERAKVVDFQLFAFVILPVASGAVASVWLITRDKQ
jgi:hypothetical protein